MKNFLFVLSRDPEGTARAARYFQFAKIAAKKGHDLTSSLIDGVVDLAN